MRIGELFKQAGVEATVVVAAGGDIARLAKQAVEAKQDVVAAAGGDGTMNAVAGALVSSDVALGVLPLGTLNHFAKDLKIPLALEAAVETIVAGHRVQIDVGEVNGTIFLNNSSLGLYPWLVRQREGLQRKGYAKWIAFAHAVIAVVRRKARLYVRLRADEVRERTRETPFVFIGNNKYELTSNRPGERAVMDGGQLWVCRAPRVGHLKLLGIALKALVGIEPKELETFETSEAWINTRAKRVSVATDGEVNVFESPLRYVSRPRALNVIVQSPQDRT